MSDPFDRLRLQTERTLAQRAALRLRATQTAERLSPARLAEDAVDYAKDLAAETGDQIRAHPFTAAGVLTVAGLALFQRPLGQLVDKWLDYLDPSVADEPPLADNEGTEPVSDG